MYSLPRRLQTLCLFLSPCIHLWSWLCPQIPPNTGYCASANSLSPYILAWKLSLRLLSLSLSGILKSLLSKGLGRQSTTYSILRSVKNLPSSTNSGGKTPQMEGGRSNKFHLDSSPRKFTEDGFGEAL
ncbi:hypothetical protein BXZ70DRAFT_549011 [Cristinia sonorae]|uniref:Uncharacterized protein n=1 Tax=Cristinia sonorae TaxID=1940300 RepID=A0A8K0UI36_9AGAR|nr:hypothetical protein BXZ70DRAFT_549011 [Cristinia sonorae]